MHQSKDTDILKSVEKLKSTIDSCQVENYRLINLLRNGKFSTPGTFAWGITQFSGAFGDSSDVNRNTKSSKTHSPVKLTHKEYLSMLIKKASEENLKLRESNVKLKQESKVQDQKIRDLNHKMKQHERNLHEKELQKIHIGDLKTSIEKKNSEIRILKQNLENVKAQLVKEQNKSKDLKEQQRNSAMRLKIRREIKSKVESLLLQLDLLLKDQDQADPIICFSDSYFNKIQIVLNKLAFMKSKLPKRELKAVSDIERSMGNDVNESEILHSNTDKGIQVSNINKSTENCNFKDPAKSEIQIDRNFCLNENSSKSVTASKLKHARNKSI